jgi:hypothetical protein
MATASIPATIPIPTVPVTVSNTFIRQFGVVLDSYPGSALREVIRLVPDGLFLGTGLFSLLTQNYAFGILFATLFEILFITIGLQKLMTFVDLPNTIPNADAIGKACKSGFQSPTLDNLSLFFKLGVKSTFPSAPVFILATAMSYVISSMQGFKDELNELGTAFSTRFYLGVGLSLLVLFIVSAHRFLSKCEGMGVIFLSLLLGFGAGAVLSWQNFSLFGPEAVNVMGIPYFSNTAADGKPLYICPPS